MGKQRHAIMPGLWYEVSSTGAKTIYAMVAGAPWELERLDPDQPIDTSRALELIAEIAADPGTE